MMDDGAVLETLQKATTQAVTLSTTPTLPIKFVSRTFVPPNDQKYLEVVFIPNNKPDSFYGNEQNLYGMYRLILHWPNDDAGAYAPLAAIKSIMGYFSKGLWLSGVKICETPKLMNVLPDGAETLYPASLSYSSFHP